MNNLKIDKFQYQGGYSGASPYTSWSRSENVARDFANSQGQGGALLKVPTGAPKASDKWKWEFSIDEYFEQEVLLKGVRKNVEVLEP